MTKDENIWRDMKFIHVMKVGNNRFKTLKKRPLSWTLCHPKILTVANNLKGEHAKF